MKCLSKERQKAWEPQGCFFLAKELAHKKPNTFRTLLHFFFFYPIVDHIKQNKHKKLLPRKESPNLIPVSKLINNYQ